MGLPAINHPVSAENNLHNTVHTEQQTGETALKEPNDPNTTKNNGLLKSIAITALIATIVFTVVHPLLGVVTGSAILFAIIAEITTREFVARLNSYNDRLDVHSMIGRD